MTLYEVLRGIIAPLVDLSLFDGSAEQAFHTILSISVSVVIVHFFVFVPYRYLLKLVRHKGVFFK